MKKYLNLFLALLIVLAFTGNGYAADKTVWLDSVKNTRVNPPDIIGVEWDQVNDVWRHIDINAKRLYLTTTDFDAHPIWGGMKRCNMNDAGVVQCYKGDSDFVLDGSNGKVMVEIPRCYVKTSQPDPNVSLYRWWVSSKPHPGFYIHYAFRQGGDGTPHYSSYLYIAAYEAGFEYDSTNTQYEMQSQTGVQPWTGGEITEIDFDDPNGVSNEPSIGDEIRTDTDSAYYIVDYHLASGAWGTDAAGTIWVRKPGDDACGFADDENIINNSDANSIVGQVNGAVSELHLDIEEARTYSQNIGSGWNITNFWEVALIRLLYYIEYADADSQTTIGEGIVDMDSGTGFAGELTGTDNIDTNVAANGTGTGDGTTGLTPIAYRGIENLWGNVWKFIDGYDAIDAQYDLLKRDGTSTFASPLVLHDSSTTAPITTDDYQINLLYETNLEFAFIPSAVGGSSSTYLCDYSYAHDSGETNTLLFSGYWSYGAAAGVGCLSSYDDASASYRLVGTRLSFLKP